MARETHRCPECEAMHIKRTRPLPAKMSRPIHATTLKLLAIFDPCRTLQEMGNEVGRSRERVRQIIKKAGLKKYDRSGYKTWPPKPLYACLQCGEPFRKQIAEGLCSIACQKAYHTITAICDGCGNPFAIMQYHLTSRTKRNIHLYCSRSCSGKIAGKHPKRKSLQ